MNRDSKTDAEYQSYLTIAKGTSTDDLKSAIEYYSTNRGLLEDLLIGFGFKHYALHIQAFQEVIGDRKKKDLH